MTNEAAGRRPTQPEVPSCRPAAASVDQQHRELLQRIQAGRPLSLAELHRAEALLESSRRSPAKHRKIRKLLLKIRLVDAPAGSPSSENVRCEPRIQVQPEVEDWQRVSSLFGPPQSPPEAVSLVG
jgi:hypothetical protein